MNIISSAFTVKVLTLFPSMFPGPLGFSLVGAALERGIWHLEALDIREFASDKHGSVDGAPYGGGSGMVIRPDVVDAALESVNSFSSPVYLTPRGRPLNQRIVRELVEQKDLTILCGRFEGVDERVLKARNLQEISIGDFVLSGGELAAMALIDSCVRLLPKVLGNTFSLVEESFEDGLLEYPQYTRPKVWKGRKVPLQLLTGHHKEIKKWRRDAAKKITRERRPDLWATYREHNTVAKD